VGGGAHIKNPVTPPENDPGTSRLVAQCLNHYYYYYYYYYIVRFSTSALRCLTSIPCDDLQYVTYTMQFPLGGLDSRVIRTESGQPPPPPIVRIPEGLTAF